MGNEKTSRTTARRAIADDSGNITLDLSQHVAISGRVALFRKEAEEAKEE